MGALRSDSAESPAITGADAFISWPIASPPRRSFDDSCGASSARRDRRDNKPKNIALRLAFITGSVSLQTLKDNRHCFNCDFLSQCVERRAAPLGHPGVFQVPANFFSRAVVIH
jgi:hypothetical protein